MHVDRAGAEEQLPRDLAVRPSHGDEAEDLELAPRVEQPAPGQVSGRPPSEPLLDGLAELLEIGGDALRERSGAQAAEGPIGGGEALHSELTLAGRHERAAAPHLRVGAIERRVHVAQPLERLLEVVRRPKRLVLEQRHLSEDVGERGDRVGAAEAGGPGRIASAQA